MPGDGPTMPDMLERVPALLATCLDDSEGRGAAIRVLRLISKDVSRIALRELRSFVVQLGYQPCPEPHQAVQLLKFSSLKRLDVHVSTRSGRSSTSLAQQLSTCTSQMTELLQGAAHALSDVRLLTLNIHHDQIRSSGCPRKCSNSGPEPPSICPASFASITRAICPMLAAALPSLQLYNVQGCCMDAAFESFGVFCPKLTAVLVEAITVPVTALRDISTSLPNLKTFDLKPPQLRPDNSRLSAYVGKCLDLLHNSTSLTSLGLGFDETTCLECKPGQWSMFPANLKGFYSMSAVNSLHNTPLLLSNLTSLYMHSYPDLDLLMLLRTAPGLQKLLFTPSSRTYNNFTLLCDKADTMEAVSLLKERIHGGLNFQAPMVNLGGTFASVQAVLAILPPLLHTSYLGVTIDRIGGGVPSPDCLGHVSRVCPNITTFAVWLFKESEDTWKGMQLLGPLTGIASLQHLRLILQTRISSKELAALCLSMPLLESVGFCRAWLEGLDDEALTADLSTGGRVIEVEQYPLI